MEPPISQAKLYPATSLDYSCLVWHVSSDYLDEVGNPNRHRGIHAIGIEQLNIEEDELIHGSDGVGKLKGFVQSIETHFKLIGPDNCTPGEIQDALYETARILIEEDKPIL